MATQTDAGAERDSGTRKIGSDQDRQPGRDQSGRAPQPVGPGVRGLLAAYDVLRVRPVEEEAAQHEEDRDPDVHAGEEPRQDETPGGSRQEPGMGEEHRDGGERPQTLELEQVVRLPRLDGRRGRARGGHEPGSTVETWADVTHTPAVLGVSTVRVTDSTATP